MMWNAIRASRSGVRDNQWNYSRVIAGTVATSVRFVSAAFAIVRA
jgi:hypothetical protein